MERIRIKDIAAKAGVSTGTVDRVLHNRGKVSPLSREKVEAALKELGYERNIIASTLAYNKVFRIAVLLPDSEIDPYWAQSKLGVEKAFKSVQHYGVSVIPYYFNLFDPKDFSKKATSIWESGSKPDALLFAPIFESEGKRLITECNEKEVPCIMINTNLDEVETLSYIGQDSYQSGVLGARLLDFGVKYGDQVLLIHLDSSILNAKHLHEKEAGFKAYFEKENNKDVEVLKVEFEEFENSQKLSEFLKDFLVDHPRITGIFVSNSRAYKVVESIDDILLSKIKIVGFDLVESNLKFLKENKIDFIINQNPVQQGYWGVINLVNHLILKKEVEKLQYLPLDIVVPENVDYYLKRELEYQLIL